jgi:SAM-dependent methyltransferase
MNGRRGRVKGAMIQAPDRARVALGRPSYVWRSGQERRLALIRRYVPLEGSRVLDVGCGIGTYVRKLRELTEQAYGIDIDAARLRQGAQAVPGLALASAEHLPFAEGSLDVILLNEVIEHVGDDALTLREAWQAVRPGGQIVIFAPNRLFPFETHGVYLGKRYVFGNIPLVNYLPGFLRRRLVPHARAYLKRDLRAITDGLNAEVVVDSYVYPGFDNIAARSRWLGGLLRAVLHWAEGTPLSMFGLSHFMVLRKRQPLSGGGGG